MEYFRTREFKNIYNVKTRSKESEEIKRVDQRKKINQSTGNLNHLRIIKNGVITNSKNIYKFTAK